MHALMLDRYGAPLRPATIPTPSPAPHEVLVRMVASGVNHVDERTRAGEFKNIFRLSLPKVVGSELAGEVVEVGSAVTDFATGDRVYGYTGMTAMGSFAETVAIDSAALAPAPSSVSLVEAASLPLSCLTVWRAFTDLWHLGPGQVVLIHGGTGSVGVVAIQLAKYLGATVVTTTSAANADYARALGADLVIDYRNEDFVARLSDAPVDLVLDTQGGDVIYRSLDVVRPDGMVIGLASVPDPAVADQIGAGPVLRLAVTVLSHRLRRRARSRGVTYRFLFFHPDGAVLRTVAEIVDRGSLRPQVARVLPFERTREALARLQAGGTRGKVVVTTQPEEVTEDGTAQG
ncbi:NADP-dependent oxidoreductase [Actinomyces wuliandei]|uniref:NADP-dependent oxidoreductase n=1 Tax=Actinomyces wuliandei TaxID=2057743 RepID=UPI000FD88D72|nr:NADP-dependent oxidoreductase [Actinomyces wuliandei]